MAQRIYLDLDGVLADFDRGAAKVLGMAPKDFEAMYGPGIFWKKLAGTQDFYDQLELMPDALELYSAVEHLGPIILTGLPRGNWAEPQKRNWAERHFPGVKVITTTAALKNEHCDPGDVLVDDRDKYRSLWEEAGGIFIHHRSARQSINELRDHGFI
ncbi:MAG: hypothetical protein M3R08_00915 [Bacteroidota bacterium]|nr:hypothetical protein [Bacteroidota bacterium]